MRGKAPAFQFYAADFLVDENVMVMSNREVGCYIKLMCFCWREKSIPAEVGRLARLCGETEDDMLSLWGNISPCFKKTGNGRLEHPRLVLERVKQEDRRKRQSESGKLGAEKRWKNK